MIVEPARAKLNLALHVRARRADGYHELETLFTFVDLGDAIRLDSMCDGFSVSGPFASALFDTPWNLIQEAARRFAAIFGGTVPGIELVKNLPVASGMGGGSADAAAALRALARWNGVTGPDAQAALAEIALDLGSDVPACLLGRTAVGCGRGEDLCPIDAAPGTPVLLVNPGVPVATGEVFRRWDGVDRGPLPDGGLIAAALAGRNDLEPPARAMAPVIGDVLDRMARQPGVVLARMSGSGATCFALFDTDAARDAAGQAMRAAKPQWWCAETALV